MKILLAPDKFKGTLAAAEVCQFIRRGLLKNYPETEVIMHPMADGGEGTLDIIKAHLHTATAQVAVQDPLFRNVVATYEYTGDTAYIEMSQASGLALLSEAERNPRLTSTIGTGQLIRHAIAQGAGKIFLFIGGSATNDAGIGMASALGYRFLDTKGQEIKPIGENLQHIQNIDASEVDQALRKVAFEVVCDVRNLLCGAEGATYVYAPQKGATHPQDLKVLEEGMLHFQQVLENTFQQDIARMEGGGAAGGLGAGAVAFLQAKISPGTTALMEITGFKSHLESVDMIITGEGKTDEQTLHGKVVHGVANEANKRKIPFGIICGLAEQVEQIMTMLKPKFIKQVVNVSKDRQDAFENAGKYVETLAEQVKLDEVLGG